MGFHAPELIVVLIVALLIFGPKKLPEMGSAIGKSIKEFRKGMNEITMPKHSDLDLPKDALDETRLPLSKKERIVDTTASYSAPEAKIEHPDE
jgi:sec-independent protein translocase protein TatA